jgi:uncharacterized protein (UPF0332 family)
MTPADFQAHAEELARDGRPANCRSAVSRGYYAAHHAAVMFLFRAGVRAPTGGRCHVAVINALISAATLDRGVSDSGSDLADLHRERTLADYRWNNLTLEDQDEALTWVQAARLIQDALEQCLADQDRLDDLWSHFRAWVPAHGGGLGLTLV